MIRSGSARFSSIEPVKGIKYLRTTFRKRWHEQFRPTFPPILTRSLKLSIFLALFRFSPALYSSLRVRDLCNTWPVLGGSIGFRNPKISDRYANPARMLQPAVAACACILCVHVRVFTCKSQMSSTHEKSLRGFPYRRVLRVSSDLTPPSIMANLFCAKKTHINKRKPVQLWAHRSRSDPKYCFNLFLPR